MTEIKKENLDKIYGGNNTISGPVINAIINIIKLVKDAGYSFGSGIRRISENNLCSLE